MIKILFITNTAFRIGDFTLSSYAASKKLGYQFHFAANLDKFDFDNNPYNDIIFHNIQCERNPISLKNIKAYQTLNKVIDEYEIDIIHCNTPIGGVLGRLCGRKKKRKVIYTVHGFHFYNGAPYLNNLIYKNIEHFFARYTDAIITINEEDYQSAKRMTLKQNGKVFKIPGVGINLEVFNNIKVQKEEIRKSLEIPLNDFVCIGVGELSKGKNFSMGIEAISKCNNACIHYIICGIGSEMDSLRELVKEYHLEKQIHLLGYRNDINELLSISDCFLFMSKREGLPRSTMEAMACGLPCIVSNVRGNVDLIVDKKGGFIVDLDSTDLSEKIKELLANEQMIKKMGEFNRNRMKKFSLNVAEEQMEYIYTVQIRGEII